jgi:hypothetical protein
MRSHYFGTQYGQSRLRDWRAVPYPNWVLERRCDRSQVVVAIASWQDRLHKPGATWAVVSVNGFYKPGATWARTSVEDGGVIRSNVLQRQGALVPSGCVSGEGAEDDHNASNQHCRKHPYSLIAVEGFHNWRLLAIPLSVKDKSRLSRLKSFALHR